MSKRTVKLSSEQYKMLRDFAKEHEGEQAALYFAKKTQTAILPYLFVYNPDFTSEETPHSARLERPVIKAAIKKQVEESGEAPDAVILLHTHPSPESDNASVDSVSLADRLMFWSYAILLKDLGIELFAASASKGTVFVLEKTKFGRVKMLDLEVDGQKIKPLTFKDRLAIEYKGDMRPFSDDTADYTFSKEKAGRIEAPDGHITIPGGITRIQNHAFKKRKDITRVSLPDGLVYIGKQAFSDCVNLSRIELPESVSVLDFGAFSFCKNLRSLVLPKTLSRIDQHAFYSCDNLKSVLICGGVESIGKDAFNGCKSLTVYCPDGSFAQEYCQKNKIKIDVNIPDPEELY